MDPSSSNGDLEHEDQHENDSILEDPTNDSILEDVHKLSFGKPTTGITGGGPLVARHYSRIIFVFELLMIVALIVLIFVYAPVWVALGVGFLIFVYVLGDLYFYRQSRGGQQQAPRQSSLPPGASRNTSYWVGQPPPRPGYTQLGQSPPSWGPQQSWGPPPSYNQSPPPTRPNFTPLGGPRDPSIVGQV